MGHIVAIEHACFNEKQLNSLEDYIYIQASVLLQLIVILSEFLRFIFEEFRA